MDEGTLGFVVEGSYLGRAFTGLAGKKLYFMVGTVWGHAEIQVNYVNGTNSKLKKQELGRVPFLPIVFAFCFSERTKSRRDLPPKSPTHVTPVFPHADRGRGLATVRAAEGAGPLPAARRRAGGRRRSRILPEETEAAVKPVKKKRSQSLSHILMSS